MTIANILAQARQSFLQLQSLSAEQRNQALVKLAELIDSESPHWLQANQLDQQNSLNQIEDALMQRLILTNDKISVVSQGVRDIARLPEILDQVTLHRELAPGLLLKRHNVPIGIIAVIFEARPDVLPQILALTLKTGNAVVLKGGKETSESNRAFMNIISQLNSNCPFLPEHWAQLIESREDVHELLAHHEDVDLVIPRGSNQLVKTVMESTKIPVLGHAEGICHLYIHEDYDPDAAVGMTLDSKLNYPSACNSLETLLVHEKLASFVIPKVAEGIKSAGGIIFGCERTLKIAHDGKPVTAWNFEHGNTNLSIRIMGGANEAIEHINNYGSKHTDTILTNNKALAEQFLRKVDSAGVFVNASTRFADGFRYGFGAEVGVSTSKTHARGPVGLEGLVTYKYTLSGQNHLVGDFTGEGAKKFSHKDLPLK